MTIRHAQKADLPTIVEIYNASIPSRIATADLTPISVESRLRWFENHSANRYPLWVMEKEDQIVGWLGFQSFLHGRPAYHATAEVSIYISPHFRRCGIGKQLLEYAIKQCPHLGINTLLGLIFAHNQPSLQLFQHYGFEQWGYLPQIADLDGIKRDLVIMGRQFVNF